MRRRHPPVRPLLAGWASALVLAGCGTAADDAASPDEDGRVPATPRALAAVVVDHVEPGEPRRSTGRWSDAADPLTLEAQVDYGVDPEGTESGESRTVRVEVAEVAAFARRDRQWWHCRPIKEDSRCEERAVDGGRLLYRWWPGVEEEEPGSYAWTVVRDDEVVRVAYDGSGLFDTDPRRTRLAVEPEDLRAAALDPALGLRTTPAARDAGAGLTTYDGEEEPPEAPVVVPTTPQQLADRVAHYLRRRPGSVVRSPLTDLGPDAVGARLRYAPTRRYAGFTVDVLTAAGRARQLDPLPCPVQDSSAAAARSCFAWDRDTVATWTLASGGRPGTLWIVGSQDDETFNRVESVAVRVSSPAVDGPFFGEPPVPDGLPPMLLADLGPLPGDLSLGPEQRVGS